MFKNNIVNKTRKTQRSNDTQTYQLIHTRTRKCTNLFISERTNLFEENPPTYSFTNVPTYSYANKPTYSFQTHQLIQIEEMRNRIVEANFKWRQAQLMVDYSYKQLDLAVAKWVEVATVDSM